MITVHAMDTFGEPILCDVNIDNIVGYDDTMIGTNGGGTYLIKETREEIKSMINCARYDRFEMLAEAFRDMGVGV